VTLAVLHTRKHIDWFVWVIVFSLGFYGVKGGLFTLLTGGSYRVWGPPGGFIQGNNELALALVMTIPLMHYLQIVTKSGWIRHGLTIAMALAAVGALGSHSRGALLAIAAMAAFLWWRSRHKLGLGVLLFGGGLALLAFMPADWEERMATIKTYEEDESAMGRIYTWKAMINIAMARVTGGGFEIYTEKVFAMFSTGEDTVLVRAAHSIYFQILGEHGFIGLALFLTFWVLVWLTAGWVYRVGRGNPETEWASQLGNMCQVSLVGYAVGGAFLSLAYFDLPYNLMVLVVLARVWIEKHSAAAATEQRSATGIDRRSSRAGQQA
jgi:putative inorganic carbon (hco3(-)) transporter